MYFCLHLFSCFTFSSLSLFAPSLSLVTPSPLFVLSLSCCSLCLFALSLSLPSFSLSPSPPSPVKVTVFALVCTLTLMVASPDTRYSKAGLYAIFATQSNDFALGYPIGKVWEVVTCVYMVVRPPGGMYQLTFIQAVRA